MLGGWDFHWRHPWFTDFLDESLSQLRNGSFSFSNGEGNTAVLDYPFATKKCFCTRTSDDDVQCSNFFTNIKFSFNPQEEENFYYVEVCFIKIILEMILLQILPLSEMKW